MAVEVIDSVKRKAHLDINKALVDILVKDKLKKYAKDAKVQGFRPGKAPRNIVEQMYGGRAYEDALNDQLNKHLVDLLDENKLDIVGYPKFDLIQSEGENFEFSAEFEVMPEVKLGDLSTKELEKPICDLSDKDIDTTIEVLLKQRATYVESDLAAAKDDKVTIDFNGTIDEVEFAGGKAENYSFILGQGKMLADFENGIEGLKSGEVKQVEVKFPENYQAENLKNKTAIFAITVKKVEKPVLPELTEEFVQSLGVADGSAETLRKDIKENLAHEIKRRLHIKARDNALNALHLISPLEVPSTLVHDEIHVMMKNAEENMKKQGYKAEQIKLTHEMFEAEAKHLVTLRLLIQQFIRENQISVSDEEVKKVVEDMALMYDDATDYVSWYYQDESRVNNAKAMAIENKVVDLLFEKANSKEVTVSYEDLMKMPV